MKNHVKSGGHGPHQKRCSKRKKWWSESPRHGKRDYGMAEIDCQIVNEIKRGENFLVGMGDKYDADVMKSFRFPIL